VEHSAPVILFVDSELASTRGLRMELKRRGARVRVAAAVDDAKHLVEREPPDLVILDRAMSDGEHHEDLAVLFSSWCPQAAMVLLDSKPSPVPPELDLRLLFYGVKPVSPETLLDIIITAFPRHLEKPAAQKPRPGMVLCVDDDPQYLRSLSRTLTRHGYRVLSYEDSTRALEALGDVSPDVAILDIMMPGIDGLDLAEKIRERSGGRLPVVFLTALDSEEACYVGHEHGASYFLTKPVEPDKVLDVVDYLAADLDDDERAILKARL